MMYVCNSNNVLLRAFLPSHQSSRDLSTSFAAFAVDANNHLNLQNMLGRLINPVVNVLDINGIIQQIDINELVEKLDFLNEVLVLLGTSTKKK
jgi:hypothetical protein